MVISLSLSLLLCCLFFIPVTLLCVFLYLFCYLRFSVINEPEISLFQKKKFKKKYTERFKLPLFGTPCPARQPNK